MYSLERQRLDSFYKPVLRQRPLSLAERTRRVPGAGDTGGAEKQRENAHHVPTFVEMFDVSCFYDNILNMKTSMMTSTSIFSFDV